MDRAVIETEGLVKAYGHVEALRGVDFAIVPGEVVALVGDNGAGKSTLVGCLSGSIRPTGGRLVVDGETCDFRSPREAQERGIATVYQDLSLATDLTPAQNVFLGREPVRGGLLGRLGWLDRAEMRRLSGAELDELGAGAAAVDGPVSALSGGQRQAVAIARALRWGRRLILLDEPTAALGVMQTRMVLDTIRTLSRRRIPVVLISHSLNDVFEVATRIVVLRLGRVVVDVPVEQTTPDDVVMALTGASLVRSRGGAR